jgi:hypothetical protein
MKSWQEIGNTIHQGAERLASMLQIGIDTAGDALTDILETLGNAVENGLVSITPTTSLGKFLAWLGDGIAGLTNIAGAMLKAGFGAVSGAAGGVIRLLGGVLSLNSRLLLKGLIDLGSNLAGAVIVIGGTLVSLVQRIFVLQGSERGLNQKEKELLRKVFGDSLALYNIRLIQGRAGVFGGNERAFTLANTIYMKNTDPALSPEILVHECVHVWQYQHVGSRYTSDALGAQAVLKDAYDWKTELARGASNWLDFNKEAQAKLIQDVWAGGSLSVDGQVSFGSGCFYDLQAAQSRSANCSAQFNNPADTALAAAAIQSLRGRRNLRLSKNLS